QEKQTPETRRDKRRETLRKQCGVPAYETGTPRGRTYFFKDTLASVGWVATASFNALIIAPGEDSPAFTKYAYRSCVIAKNAGCWSAGMPMRVAREVRCSP